MGTKPFAKVVVLSFLFLISCTSKEKPKQDPVVSETVLQEVYICPMECENGMNYYMEGKCDICHINLIKQEKP